MMPGPETKRKLREPGVPSMIEVVEMLESDASFAALPLDDRLRVVVDYAYQEAENAHVARLLRNAHLRLPQAGVANIDYDGRPPGRTPVTVLATKPSIGRNACLPGTTNGTPWETRALRCLASICATIATGMPARAETWEAILLSSGRDASRSTSAAMKPTPLQEHRR